MESMPPNGSIHGLRGYINYSPVIKMSTMEAFIPLLYIIPTMVVMLRILILYHRARAATLTGTIDHNIFACIMFYFLFNMLFFIGDYLHLNLPASGLITSWCASTEPSLLYTIIIFYAYYSNFGVIICPFLVCIIRLTILASPRHNDRYCRLLMRRFVIPFLFITPLLLTICNVNITGYCRQMGEPFDFGSVIIYEGDSLAGLNVIIHLSFSIVLFLSECVMSLVMVYKLRKTVFNTSSDRTKALSRKAEKSFFLTLASSMVPFMTNSIVSLTFLIDRPQMFRVLFLRPIGNDYETVMMPWVLYLTHPMFRRKTQPSESSNALSMWQNKP